MGLDMYLDKIVKNKSEEGEKELMYWRKANAIHRWFVENVQGGEDNCEPHLVTLKQLRELRTICYDILATPNAASELLPTQSGFFFGPTEYDEYYYHDLKVTAKALDEFFEELKEGEEPIVIYRSCW